MELSMARVMSPDTSMLCIRKEEPHECLWPACGKALSQRRDLTQHFHMGCNTVIMTEYAFGNFEYLD